MACNDDIYQHQPLPDPRAYVRLLELEHTETWGDDDIIRCSLTVWPLEKAPPYHAISYTWGDPSPNYEVEIAGRTLWIPENTAEALGVLAYHQKSRYYWIDAVCIAQGSISEKNGQVAIMGEVFKRAQHVLVCLESQPDEDGEDKAEAAMQMISEFEGQASFRANSGGQAHWNEVEDPEGYAQEPWMDREEHEVEAIDELLEEALTALINVLGPRFVQYTAGLSFLSWSDYFSRMWVVQELLLSSGASICRGTVCLPSRTLYAHLSLVLWISTASKAGGSQLKSISQYKRLNAVLEDRRLTFREQHAWPPNDDALELLRRQILAPSYVSRSPLQPCDALWMARYRFCADGRDTLYSMLAVIEWPTTPIEPDYNKSPFHLAMDFCKHIDQRHINDDTAQILVNKLGIDLEDPALQSAIAIRHARRNASSLTAHGVSTLPSVQGERVLGLPLTEASCRRIGPREFLIPLGDDGSSVTVFAFDVVWDDWVVYESTTLGDMNPSCGYIVRSCGNVYEIVDRAYLVDHRIHRVNKGRFDIYHDPEDLIVSRCITNEVGDPRSAFRNFETLDQSMQDLLRTPICKAPLSSFAKLTHDYRRPIRAGRDHDDPQANE